HRAVRAAGAGGLPVRPVLDHGAAQAPRVPRGVRRVRPGGRRRVRGAGRRSAARRRPHHPEPAEDRRDDRQRARPARAPRQRAHARRARVVVRAPAAGPPPRRMGRRPGLHARVDRAVEGAQEARVPVRRADDRLRRDAGVRARGRPPRDVPRRPPTPAGRRRGLLGGRGLALGTSTTETPSGGRTSGPNTCPEAATGWPGAPGTGRGKTRSDDRPRRRGVARRSGHRPTEDAVQRPAEAATGWPGAPSAGRRAPDDRTGSRHGPTMDRMSTYVSVLDLFSIGVGPSSSHTVGPMRAATAFVTALAERGTLDRVAGLRVVLCGSLGSTGVGHGTPDAVVAGLLGLDPQTCDPDVVPGSCAKPGDGAPVPLRGRHRVTMSRADVRLAPLTRMPGHPNGMRFTALDAAGDVLAEEAYYSVGGGFVLTAAELEAAATTEAAQVGAELAGEPVDPGDEPTGVPYPFANAAELLAVCARERTSIAAVAWANESALRPASEVEAGLDRIWDAMSACVDAGLDRDG